MRGGRSHFVLLLRKNFKLLIRAPVTLTCEILIPLLVLLMFFGISRTFPTIQHCFSTYPAEDNYLAIPDILDVKIAVAPATQKARDIIDAVLRQDQVDVSLSKLDFVFRQDQVDVSLSKLDFVFRQDQVDVSLTKLDFVFRQDQVDVSLSKLDFVFRQDQVDVSLTKLDFVFRQDQVDVSLTKLDFVFRQDQVDVSLSKLDFVFRQDQVDVSLSKLDFVFRQDQVDVSLSKLDFVFRQDQVDVSLTKLDFVFRQDQVDVSLSKLDFVFRQDQVDVSLSKLDFVFRQDQVDVSLTKLDFVFRQDQVDVSLSKLDFVFRQDQVDVSLTKLDFVFRQDQVDVSLTKLDFVFRQDQVDVSLSKLDFVETAERLNTILKDSPSTYHGAVIFNNFRLGDEVLPDNISYTIRYPTKSTMQFQFQQAIDRAIIHLKSGTPFSDILEARPRQLPFPHWVENWFLVGLSESFPLMIIIGFMWNVFITTKDIAKDRDTGVREIFKSLGISNWSILGSWYCLRFLVAVAVATLMTIALSVLQILKFSSMFLVWIVLMLYTVSAVNMCFLMGTFISSSTLGMFAILISYMISFAPFLALSQDTDQHPDYIKYLCSLLSPTAGSLALANIGNWEAEGIGLTWDNLDQCTGPSEFSALKAIYMLIIDSLIYGTLFVYLDEIFPGKHGIGLHWTYFLDKKYWRPVRTRTLSQSHETLRGVEMRGVRKNYHSRGRIARAVNGITTKFRESEISTLLGYNGAGKTTTLKMLAAMHSPSHGEIIINGLDLAENAVTIRKTLGYCPQYNILIDDLTVNEHLHLFTSLKGLHGNNRDREIDMSIKKLGFTEHRNSLVQHLSGGMKRKLSLGLALCGHPKVIILDEPTTGMDIAARKATWELLLNHRQGRTIIVSTHDMDEADLLSDRCFVLSEGRIISSGTSTSIKSLHGEGYQLTISVENQDRMFLPLLQQYLPGAKMIRKSYKEQVFSISDDDKVNLIKLLRKLDEEVAKSGITGYGLMESDLEGALANLIKNQTIQSDVALESAEATGFVSKLKYWMFGAADDIDHSPTINGSNSIAQKQYQTMPKDTNTHFCDRYSGVALGLNRLVILVKKRILDDKRNTFGIIMKLVIPLFLMIFGITFLKLNQKAEQFNYTLDIGGLAQNPDYLMIVDLAHKEIFNPKNKKLKNIQNLKYLDVTKEIEKSVGRDYKNPDCCSYSFLQLEESCSNITWDSPVWTNCLKEPTFGYRDCFQDCFQRDILMDYQGCSAGQRPGENSPAQIDYFQDRFLNWSVPYSFRKYHHHVLTSSVESGRTTLTAWFSPMRRHSISQSVNVINNMLLGFYSNNTAGTITTSYWPYTTIDERLAQASEISLPLMIMAMFTTFAGTFIAGSFSLFLVKERVTKMKHLQLMAGISGRVYWYANLLWDHLVFLLFTATTLTLLALFSIAEFGGLNGLALFMLMVMFAYAALPITHLLSMIIDSAVLCFAVICTSGFLLGMCGIMLSIYIDNSHLDSVLALIPYSALGIGIIDLYTNENLKSFNAVCNCTSGFVDSPFSTESPGVGLQLLSLAIEGSVLTVLLICVEELVVFIQLYYYREDVRNLVQVDGDVYKERRDMKKEVADGYPVVVDSISKVLSDRLVLNNVTFGMQKTQCVALLGHNGAGKTTLFSILSGEVIPTFGCVNLFGTRMITDIRGYRERVGYCPQEPATFPYMTGREVLTLFAGLRGLKKKKAEEIVSRLLAWTGLTRYGERETRNYSGGTLRKLSLAISLIGDPPVLLLDEPSASVDPTSRRMLWKLLRQLADSGKSILISTHVKGEVEAVCDKVVILSEGNTVAVGPCNQVKDKFGSGFALQVAVADPSEVNLAKAAIEQRLKDVSFVHKVGKHLQYFVPRSSFTYSDVFMAVELIKQLVKLDHYSVCQLSFSQLDLLTRTASREGSNLNSFVRRIHGLVRRSFKESFTQKRSGTSYTLQNASHV
ncbi:hypothetical protein ACHWQZ_G015086 [Mnemiopsis leidyi]